MSFKDGGRDGVDQKMTKGGEGVWTPLKNNILMVPSVFMPFSQKYKMATIVWTKKSKQN